MNFNASSRIYVYARVLSCALYDRILRSAKEGKKRQVHGNMAGPIFRTTFPGMMTQILESQAYCGLFFTECYRWIALRRDSRFCSDLFLEKCKL